MMDAQKPQAKQDGFVPPPGWASPQPQQIQLQQMKPSQAQPSQAATEPPAADTPTPTAAAPPVAATPTAATTPTPLLIGLALAIYLTSYLFFSLNILDGIYFGLNITLFFGLMLAVTLVGLLVAKVRLGLGSWLLFTAAVGGALGFLLYGERDIAVLLFLGEACLCLFWLAFSCRSLIARPLSLLLALDWVNQFFVVPFANFGAIFTRPWRGNGKRSTVKVVGISVLCLVVSLPVIGLVVYLLASSSTPFNGFLHNVFSAIDLSNINIANQLLYLFLAIPLAAWFFGMLLGNLEKRHTGHIPRAGVLSGLAKFQAIPKVALFLPAGLLILIYVIYLVTFAPYLFSALSGILPLDYTYADYARQGFFELAGVASINLAGLGVLWLLSKRGEARYPLAMRVVSLVFCLLTCLLIAVAMSKLLLYIGAYGLTPLRLYVGVFLGLLAVAFVLLGAWSLHAFNAFRPVLAAVVAVFLVFSLANTNAWIADYNVSRYLSGTEAGTEEQVDVDALAALGPAAAPSLLRLKNESADNVVAADAQSRLNALADERNGANARPWYAFSLNELKVWGVGTGK